MSAIATSTADAFRRHGIDFAAPPRLRRMPHAPRKVQPLCAHFIFAAARSASGTGERSTAAPHSSLRAPLPGFCGLACSATGAEPKDSVVCAEG
jgi:hypothetical protein